MIDLEKIEDPSFVKSLSKQELKQLAQQIREFLIENISKTGGHLASNLGVVEITLALNYVFDQNVDQMIFDVGHQSYVHKILTGRAKEFSTLRKFGGISGYVSSSESKYDVWESGHSSNSISAMSGFLIADKDKTNQKRVISIIGDSSIANGLAFEGLNFLGNNKELAPIIVLNDNKMGISRSVGAMSKLFSRLRGTKAWRRFKQIMNAIFPTFITNRFHRIKQAFKAFFLADNVFENMGFSYYGPINGNNLSGLIKTFERVKKLNKPVIIHCLTKKGCGYKFAEEDMAGSFHGVGPFDVETGKPLTPSVPNRYSFSSISAGAICSIRKNQRFFVVTPAMKVGTEMGLFSKKFPEDFYDVGIMEEHAATMTAGIAKQGKSVVLLMYSTFAQRAYDEILNDICRQNLKVIIGIDRAGVVGDDGSTHQGIYDVSMFNAMPNMMICMAKDGNELVSLWRYAFKAPTSIVIRYPKGKVDFDMEEIDNIPGLETPSWEIICEGSKGIVISYGNDIIRLQKLIKENNLDVTLVNARFIRPVDADILTKVFEMNKPILVIEQVVQVGTLLDNIIHFAIDNGFNTSLVKAKGFSANDIIQHGSIKEVLEYYGFGDAEFVKEIKKLYEN